MTLIGLNQWSPTFSTPWTGWGSWAHARGGHPYTCEWAGGMRMHARVGGVHTCMGAQGVLACGRGVLTWAGAGHARPHAQAGRGRGWAGHLCVRVGRPCVQGGGRSASAARSCQGQGPVPGLRRGLGTLGLNDLGPKPFHPVPVSCPLRSLISIFLQKYLERRELNVKHQLYST